MKIKMLFLSWIINSAQWCHFASRFCQDFNQGTLEKGCPIILIKIVEILKKGPFTGPKNGFARTRSKSYLKQE